MFTQKGPSASWSWQRARRATLTRTSGGSADTDVKEFMVAPRGPLSVAYDTIVTPVAKRDMQARSAPGLGGANASGIRGSLGSIARDARPEETCPLTDPGDKVEQLLLRAYNQCFD